MAFPNIGLDVPIDVAQDQGFFKANGLSVKVIDGATGPANVASIASGNADIATVPIDVAISSVRSGASIEALSGLSGPGGSLLLVSNRISATSAAYPASAKVLAGKTIGIFGAGSYSDRLFRYTMSHAGVKTQYAVVAGTAPSIAAMKAGRIDATDSDPLSAIAPEKEGIAHVLYNYVKTGPPSILGVPVTGAFASPKFIKNNPAAAKGFVRALAQAGAWMNNSANMDKLTQYVEHLGAQSPTRTQVKAVVAAFDLVLTRADFAKSYVINPGAPIDTASLLGPTVPASNADVQALAKSK